MDNFKIVLPKDVDFILNKIEENGYEAVVVGGSVRNQLINKIHSENYLIKDYDIASNCPYNKLKEIFKGFSIEEVGASFGVLLIKMNGQHYEVALYRKDGEYSDSRRPNYVEFTSDLKTDISRRDFTVNGICYSLSKGLIDYHNGIEDIKMLVLRFIGNPEDRLNEDILRYIRMYRFATQYNMVYPAIDFDKYNKRLSNISKERIRDEFNKILISDNCVNGLRNMIEDGVLQIIVPEFEKCIDFNQNNPHHSKVLHEHILDVIGATPNDLILRLSALFHDIAKPNVQTTDENGISHYITHEIESAKICSKWMTEYKYTNKQIKEVNDLISNHMKQHSGIKHKGIKKLINNIGIETTSKLIKLFYADRVGKEGELKHIDNIKELFENIVATQQPTQIKDLVVNGNDLIELGIKGKNIGEMLNVLLNIVMEDPNWNNKERLLKKAKQLILNTPIMYMMSGIPRSGKNTWIENNLPNIITCSADDFREQILGEKGNMSQEKRIWDILENFYHQILIQRKDIVLNNTNVKNKYRKKYIDLAKQCGYKVVGIQMNTPLEVCLERAKQTNFPEDILMRFFSNYQPLKYEEGFDEIKMIGGGN